jgi:plastocyanin
MKSTVVISLLVLAVIGSLVYMSMSKKSSDSAMEATKQEAMVKEDSATKGDAMTAENTITVEGSDFKFNPATITVKKGETVKITLKNTDASDEFEIKHDFVIDELDVQSPEIGEGETTTFEFVADQAGTFEYYCSIGEHRAMGMFGTLTVEE